MGDDNFADKEVIEEKFPLQGSVSLNLSGEKEEIMEELKNCLPKWVTEEQVRDMIREISGNVIEIVDYFYEHETKFYEEISDFVALSAREDVSFGNNEVFVSQLEFQSSVSSQFQKLKSISSSQKSKIPPVKRNTKVKGKQKKKTKGCSKVESGGPKQATITKFFNKVSLDETKD